MTTEASTPGTTAVVRIFTCQPAVSIDLVMSVCVIFSLKCVYNVRARVCGPLGAALSKTPTATTNRNLFTSLPAVRMSHVTYMNINQK